MSAALQSPDMPIGTPRIPWKCRQCDYEWFSRTKKRPERCPPPNGCGSSLWEREAQKRGPKPNSRPKGKPKGQKPDAPKKRKEK